MALVRMGSSMMWAIIAFILGLLVGYLASGTMFFVLAMLGVVITLIFMYLRAHMIWAFVIIAGVLGMLVGRFVM